MRIGIALVAGVVVLGLAPAGAARAERYSLDQAVAYALEHNPGLLAAQEQALAAGALARAAQGAHAPQLDLNYVARASNNPLDAFADKLNTRRVTAADFDPARLNYPGRSELHGTELALRLPIYSGGRIGAEVRGAAETERTFVAQFGRRRDLTAYDAASAYLGAQTAQRALAVVEAAVAAAQKHADTTATLLRQGRILESDHLSAQVNLAALQGRREQARTRAALALNQLKFAMGLALDVEIEIDPWSNARAAAAPDLPEIEKRALGARQDLHGGRALVDAARARVDAARAAHLPQLNLVASRNWYDSEPHAEADSWSVMGVVNLNLFAGGQLQNRIAASRHDAAHAEFQLQALESRVRNEVREAHARLHEARARLAIAESNTAKAERAVKLIDRRYGEGRTILLDVLQAERALVDTRNEALTAAFGVAAGEVALRLAEGTLAGQGR